MIYGLAEDHAHRGVVVASGTPSQSSFRGRMTHDPSSYHLIFHGEFEANNLKSFVLRPDDFLHLVGTGRIDSGVTYSWDRGGF